MTYRDPARAGTVESMSSTRDALAGPCPVTTGERRAELSCLACGPALAACPYLAAAAARLEQLDDPPRPVGIPAGWLDRELARA